MAKRNNNYEKSPLKMVIYILAVLFLLGCIGYLLVCSRREKVAYREELEKVSALEADTETSEEKETEKQQEEPSEEKEKAAVTKAAEETTASVTPKVTEVPEETVTPGVTETPALTATPSLTVTPGLTGTPAPAAENADEEIAEADKNVGVLVLNGTKRPGVAAYWKTKLETAGYENVVPATYNKTVGQETIIYAPDVDAAKPFLELFPNATVQVGTIAEGIELQAGVVLPENCEVYIVIGNNDVNR